MWIGRRRDLTKGPLCKAGFDPASWMISQIHWRQTPRGTPRLGAFPLLWGDLDQGEIFGVTQSRKSFQSAEIFRVLTLKA